jgi:hypothetical protein
MMSLASFGPTIDVAVTRKRGVHQEKHTLLYWLYKATIKPEKLQSLKLYSLGSFFVKLQEIKPIKPLK